MSERAGEVRPDAETIEISGVLPRVRGGVSRGVRKGEPLGTLGGGVDPAEGGGAPGIEREDGVAAPSEPTDSIPLPTSEVVNGRLPSDSPSIERTSRIVDASEEGDNGTDSDGGMMTDRCEAESDGRKELEEVTEDGRGDSRTKDGCNAAGEVDEDGRIGADL